MSDAEKLQRIREAQTQHARRCLTCKAKEPCWEADALARRANLIERFDEDLRPKS